MVAAENRTGSYLAPGRLAKHLSTPHPGEYLKKYFFFCGLGGINHVLMVTSGLDRPAMGRGQEINTGVSTATKGKGTRFTSKIQNQNIYSWVTNPKSKYILLGYRSVFIFYGSGSSISKNFGSEAKS
jgi:hypothetical protein